MEPDAAGAVVTEMDATVAAEVMTVMDYDDGAAAVMTDALSASRPFKVHTFYVEFQGNSGKALLAMELICIKCL